VSSEPTAGEVLYNTITTPAGGQYKLELPDGSKVWLNAGSSLYFPASFTGSKRMVKLTGEAYFEVAKVRSEGKKRPFIVVIPPSASGIGGGQVEVLGTHFNVNAYNDESVIKTTLLEGKVKVSSANAALANNKPQTSNYKLLSPGKQALLNSQTHTIKITDANTEQAVAWKNGFFRFKETGIHELMRQVARWYDVDVEYQTNRTDQYYTGVISRSQNISALLQMLELTGTVHFQIDNNPVNGKQGKIVVL
jgi:ferric-dicitrate binding protein FerR (iron transport regulator)